MAPKVLFVLTSHSSLPNGKPTGWYLPEFAHPYYKLAPHAEVVVASPKGGEAPLDPASVEASKDDAESQKFLKEKTELWKKTEKLADFKGKASEFAAIFYVGGHGPMFDLATDATSQEIIREFYESGRVVSAVCHGPAAFVNVKLSDGSYLLAGQAVTGFSNSEESMMGFTGEMPFALEDDLNKNSGGKFEKAAENFGAKVVVAGKDGRIISGQNPASAAPLGEAVLKAIKA